MFAKKYSTADQDLYKYASSVFKDVQQDAKEWSVSMLYKEDDFGSRNKKRTGNIYKDAYKIFHAAAAVMQESIDNKFAAAEDSDSNEKKLCNLRKEAARLVISKARKTAQKNLHRSYTRKENAYMKERALRAKHGWAILARYVQAARKKEQEHVLGPLGGARRQPSAAWVAEQFKLHKSIVDGKFYSRAQRFLWAAKLENFESLIKFLQADDKKDSKQPVLVTPGYQRLAYYHCEREMRLGNFDAARAWVIEAIYRAHLWDVSESPEWASYFAKAGRKEVDGTHTSSQVQALLKDVPGNLVHLLAGQDPFEYHEVKTTDARLGSNAEGVWTTIHPRDAHTVFGRVCTDPARKYTVEYTRRGGLSLWGHAPVKKGEPYTFYGEVGSPRQIAESAPADVQRSQRGDFSHRHAVYGTSSLLCGRFSTPATPSGAGQWANHPGAEERATLQPRLYAVRHAESSGPTRSFYVLVLVAAQDQGQVELTHAYTDRYPGVSTFVYLAFV